MTKSGFDNKEIIWLTASGKKKLVQLKSPAAMTLNGRSLVVETEGARFVSLPPYVTLFLQLP